MPGRKLLIIDDNELVCRAVGRIIKTHEVITALTGEVALEALTSGDVGMVLVDNELGDYPTRWSSGIALSMEILARYPQLDGRVYLFTGRLASSFAESAPGLPVVEKPILDTAKFRAFVADTLGD